MEGIVVEICARRKESVDGDSGKRENQRLGQVERYEVRVWWEKMLVVVVKW